MKVSKILKKTLKLLIIFTIVIVVSSIGFLYYKTNKISKIYAVQSKKSLAAYYLANQDQKLLLSLYVKLFPEVVEEILRASIKNIDLKAINSISSTIPDPYFRYQDGASTIGLLSTLISVQKNNHHNYYNLEENESLKLSEIENSIGFEYLQKYKIENRQDNFVTKIHESNLMVKLQKLLKIPGVSKATYNPSILPFADGYILAFRIDNFIKFYNLSERYHDYTSDIGIVKLDKDFNVVGDYELISNYIDGCPDRCSAEDPRLIYVGDKIYMLYNRGETIATKDIQSNRKMYLSEVEYNNNKFSIKNTIPLISPFQYLSVERNWVPFVKEGELYFVYSVEPNLMILKPDLKTGISEIVRNSYFDSKSQFGQIKGGTPLIEISKNKYLGVFHSNIDNGKKRIYYLTPAIFDINDEKYKFTSILNYPVFLDLYSFPDELFVSLFFPCGIALEGDDIILSSGKNDGEILLMRIDKSKLLKELDNYKY